MRTIKRIQFAFLLIAIAEHAYTQEAGRTFIKNYTPQEYRANQQNWAIAQDRRGIMYFGNSDGLLEFDGTNWRLIKLPVVRSIATDSLGQLFVGLENDFGYLKPDASGNYQYFSLKSKIPETERDLTPVFTLCILGKKVLFLTNEKLYIYQNDQVKVLAPENGFHHMYLVHNRLYIREPGHGLFYLEGDSLTFIEGSESFAEDKIFSMLPYGPEEILIVSRNSGIMIYSPLRGEKFKKSDAFKEVDNFLLTNPAYNGESLANGDFAIGTLTGGILVFDRHGKINNLYRKNTGLQDNTILYLYSDQNHQLWAALDQGISLIENNLPFQIYSDQNGLNGTPLCLKYFNNRLYAGTSQTLHFQNQKGDFEPVAGTESQNFCLYESNGTLLLARNPGIFEIRGSQSIPVANTFEISVSTFCPLKNHSEYVLAGGDGLFLLEYKNKSWKLKHNIAGFYKSVYEVVEDNNENFWISTMVNLFKLKINSVSDSVLSFEQCNIDQGLPTEYAYPFRLNSGEVVFGTEKGIYRYMSESDKFELHPEFRLLTGKVLPFVQNKNGDIWYDELLENGNHEKGVLKYSNGKYIQYKIPFYKFNSISLSESQFNICFAPDSSIFFGTTSGLLHYNLAIEVNYQLPFNTLIRSVFAKDSLMFGGAGSNLADREKNKGIEIRFSHHDMTFHFAAAFYEDPEKNLYSYRLIGSDTAWSSWLSDNKKEYTNLPEGKYTFEVKSKNQYQETGSTASYQFIILPPWYRTWWAFGIYAALAVLFIWLIVRLNIQRLVKQKEQLEVIVTERTAEVVRQKKQIETAHGQITASINYAKYIQSSMLPKKEQLDSCLGEHFILHKPAEIVSGDFYWISETGNRIIIAAVDCTGHGVPGAFMSMLGITLLNEIVNKDLVTSPDLILDRLRMEVIASLKQKGERLEQKDGMDIALCSIDRQNMKLQFAGAINPLYLIRNSVSENSRIIQNEANTNEELIEIKGDNMPIGIADEMDSFALREIEIQKGDSYYIFTDGFPDQFGGPKHKKFSYKQFREVLIKNKLHSMPEQKIFLENVLNEWMGNNNQTDDILVIGFRIS
jgi:serine phosphatase RsbU (regulator of sigma subunit)/ligand-binding sensor domain-containing protein